MKISILLFFIWVTLLNVNAQETDVNVGKLLKVSDGWAGNTVNTTVFRKNSLVTFKDTQYIAFYNNDAHVVLGKRKLGTEVWTTHQTQYRGNVRDAHNVISIMVDGDGYLHLSWDHHNNKLNYCKGMKPGSLEMGARISMTGKDESSVSYPEFYKMPGGNLLFFYRDGGSGRGNLVINSYNVKSKSWTRIHDNLISGEGQRNAYWQACVDKKGRVHVSWVWRESPDVASNHDMGYARSNDGGLTWETSQGKNYSLPITASTAEYALKIPPNSELMNQTSMDCDEKGNPFIASYWKDTISGFPQYHILYKVRSNWETFPLAFRETGFSLKGMGTKRIPISRPQIMVDGKRKKASVLMIFRDEARGGKASALTINKVSKRKFNILDLNAASLGSWEPTFDTELWKQNKILNLFVQQTEQKDGEGVLSVPAQPVSVLEWKPRF